MESKSCYQCIYLSKKPGIKNYFIFKCNYWGLITKNILPQSVVISSIGKQCPFFKKKEKKTTNKNKSDKNEKNTDDGFDIII